MRRTLFDDEHELFRDSVRRFIAAEAAPHNERVGGRRDRRPDAVHRGRRPRLPRHGRARASYGGGGVDDFRYNLVIAEEVQRGGVNAAGLGLTLHNDICLPYFLRSAPTSRRRAGCPASARAS